MAGRLLTAMAVVLAIGMLAIDTAPALAQPTSSCPYYYPIRAVGAACTGDYIAITGSNACCKAAPRAPQSQPQRGGGGYSGGGGNSNSNRIAAGLAAGGLMLDVLSILFDMASSSAVPIQDTSEEQQRNMRIQGERADALWRASQWNATAVAAMKSGDDKTASAHFAAAVKYAEDANDTDAINLYKRNQHLIEAQILLKEALAAKAERRYEESEKLLMRSSFYAGLANRPDLRDRIRNYRRELRTQNPATAQKPFKEETSCVTVNGELMCD